MEPLQAAHRPHRHPADRERAAGRPRRCGRCSPSAPCSGPSPARCSRAAETARLAGFGDAEPRDELLEFDYGEYEGRTTAEIRAERPGWYLWRDGCPGGETPAEVAERVGRLIAELREEGVDAALFGHGHVLRALAARWLGLGPEAGGPVRAGDRDA